VASLAIAWAMAGASAYAFAAADEVAPAGPDSGPKLAIGLATAAFLVVLLLLLRVSRLRRRADRLAALRDGEGDAGDAAPEPVAAGGEADLPRWRRPSVVAARFGFSSPAATRTDRLAFEPDADQPAERLVVRYDAVPLVHEPDDLHGRTIAELSAGDEVEVIERQAMWVHVRTPAARSGWVPAMTLATLGELPPEVWEPVAEPEEAGPIDQGPPLEALLEAIAAERRNQLAAASARQEAPATTPAVEPRPKRTRTPRATPAPAATTRPSTRRKAATSES
jgi:hypothetical protein